MGKLRKMSFRALRNADWLDQRRARAYCSILAALSLVAALGYLALSQAGLDVTGKPVGTDFASFYTASQLALAGAPEHAWNTARHADAQARLFGSAAGYAAFFYPPPYLVVCLPLALLPYLLSLSVWLAATFASWLYAMRKWIAAIGNTSLGVLPLAAFPAVLVNAGHGQNGFLTGALMSGGALLHGKRPWLAGLLFGALVIKPQFGVLIPFFLAFSGNWRCFLATGLTAVALCAVSFAVFGLHAWEAFFASSQSAQAVLSDNLVGFHKMQSTFAAARLLGLGDALAWAGQGAAIVFAVASLYLTRAQDDLARGALFCCASLIATPFVLDYDLMLLAVPLAWLFTQGERTGFADFEKLGLLSAFALPLLSRPLALGLGLPMAPLVLVGLMFLMLRRAKASPPA